MAAAIRALPVYAGATPVAPPVAAAATEAARLFAEGGVRRRLAERIEAMRALAPPSMRPLPEPGLPWFGIRHESARVLARWSRTLADRGFLAPHVRYFGGPAEGMLKVAVSAAHSERDLERLARAVATL
ncbi:MAG: hypothetical protein HMLKMBBP_03828 [Planctomycetes bacterium]|nr:hypothetical protein [Planctomycetota bacterium]